MCARADVVIENFRPGGAARLGLDYEAVRKRGPVSSTARSAASVRANRVTGAGYDFTVQAESGLMAITGEPDGEPMKVGVAIVDVLAGLHAATAILAALRRRELTGEGDLVEVSLLDSAFAASSTSERTPCSREQSRCATATRTRASSPTSRSAPPMAGSR